MANYVIILRGPECSSLIPTVSLSPHTDSRLNIDFSCSTWIYFMNLSSSVKAGFSIVSRDDKPYIITNKYLNDYEGTNHMA